MEKLFSRRRSQHFLLLLKYWRLVFNDHFVIALFFMFGALAWGYSQALGQLSTTLLWSRPLAILVLLVILQLGRLATLVQPADPVFLLPQAQMINRYLHQALHYSLLLAECITVVLSVITLPFVMATTRATLWDAGLLIIAMALLKVSWLNWRLCRLYQRASKWWTLLISWGLPLIIMFVGFYLSWLVAASFSFVLMVLIQWQQRRMTQTILNWRLAVKLEQQRMLGIYRFFNLFTDVPLVQGVVHRRRYLDGLVRLFSRSQHPFAYLYARGFFRGTEVSGLIIRLTAVGMAILFFVPIFWLNLVIMVLFIYLIMVQLIPFYWHFESHVFTHLYPVTAHEQTQDFKKLSFKILLVAFLGLWMASIGTTANVSQMGIKLIVGLAEVGMLIYGYLGYRIQRKNNKY